MWTFLHSVGQYTRVHYLTKSRGVAALYFYMRWDRGIAEEIRDRSASRASELVRILTQKQAEDSGTVLGENQRLVEFQIPHGIYVQHPWMGAQAQKLPARKFQVPLMIDDQGELMSRHLADTLTEFRPGPSHAVRNMAVMQRFIRALQREAGIGLKNLGEFQPSSALQRAWELGGDSAMRLVQEESRSMAHSTSIHMLLPQQVFLPRDSGLRFLPSTGVMPAALSPPAYIHRMNNGLGVSQNRLVGSEIVGSMTASDADGDRMTVAVARIMDAENRERAKQIRVSHFPGTFISGPSEDAAPWYAQTEARARGLKGLEQDLHYLRSVSFREGQNPHRLAEKVFTGWKKTLMASSRERIEEQLLKSFRGSSSAIGQVTYATSARQMAESLHLLEKASPEQRSAVLQSPSTFEAFMAMSQRMKFEGGPEGTRQLVESAIQAALKGRGELDKILSDMPLGFRKDVFALYSQKDITGLSVGQANELTAHLMAGGNVQSAIRKARLGQIKASDLDAGRYGRPVPSPGLELLERRSVDLEKSGLGYLRELGMFETSTLGLRKDQSIAGAQIMIVRDPSTGEMIPQFNRIALAEDGTEIHKAFAMRGIRTVNAEGGIQDYSPFEWMARELEADSDFMAALTVKDNTLPEGSRRVGELVGQWDYDRVMRGDEGRRKIRQLAANLDLPENQVYAEFSRGRSHAQKLVARHELTRDPWRYRTIIDRLEAFLAMGAQEVSYRVEGGLPQIPQTTRTWAENTVMLDLGLRAGPEEEYVQRGLHIIEKSPDLAPEVYKTYADNRLLSMTLRQSPVEEDLLNYKRWMVNVHQGLNSPLEKVKMAMVQVDKERLLDLIQSQAQMYGYPVDRAEALIMLGELVPGKIPGVSIKGLDFWGQEQTMVGADTVQRVFEGIKGLVDARKSGDPAQVMKFVSQQTGAVKNVGTFSSLRYELRTKSGNIVPLDILQSVEAMAARENLPEVLNQIVMGNPSHETQNAWKALKSFVKEGGDQLENHEQFLSMLQNLTDAAGLEGSLWAVGVGEDNREILITEGRIPVWEDTIAQALNSTEQYTNELFEVKDLFRMTAEERKEWIARGGRAPWGVHNPATIQDLMVELELQIAQIPRLLGESGEAAATRQQQLREGLMNYVDTFVDEPTGYNIHTPKLFELLEDFSPITGLLTDQERLKIAERAQKEVWEGASEMLLNSGITSVAGESVSKGTQMEALNTSTQVAEQVFGRQTGSGTLLSRIGQNVLKQFLS